tara:strand:- start:397 stop:1242 length:846 start_codon:yes stop_codon:yes gene_type:complete
MGFIEDIVQQYFLDPVNNPAVQGYNIVNTVVYVGLLLVLAFFVIFPLLDRRGVKFSEKFAVALLPYIFIGSAMRLLVSDNCTAAWTVCFQKVLNPLSPGFWFFTPGVWFSTFILVIIGLLIARKLKGTEYHKTFGVIGIIFLIPFLLLDFLHFSNWIPFLGTVVLILAIMFVIKFVVDRFTKTGLMKNKLNILAVGGQVVDGTATVVATTWFGFSEQHPLSAGILDVHPGLFLIVKIVLMLAILHYVEKDIEKENLRGYFKLFLVIVGFATGTASLLKLGI